MFGRSFLMLLLHHTNRHAVTGVSPFDTLMMNHELRNKLPNFAEPPMEFEKNHDTQRKLKRDIVVNQRGGTKG